MVRFIDGVTRGRAALNDEVSVPGRGPGLAALLDGQGQPGRRAAGDPAARRGSAARPGRRRPSVDLTTVVGNLVDNALDAAAQPEDAEDAGGGGWHDALGRGGRPRGRPDVVVAVRDSGPGVAAGLEQRVFERGFTTKDRHRVEPRASAWPSPAWSAAAVAATSRVHNDGGAVFTARLRPAPGGARRDPGAGGRRRLHGGADPPRLRRAHARVHRRRTSAPRAPGRRRRTRGCEPDLVLLDIHLPDVNGLDLLPRLREGHPDLDGSSSVPPVRPRRCARRCAAASCTTCSSRSRATTCATACCTTSSPTGGWTPRTPPSSRTSTGSSAALPFR